MPEVIRIDPLSPEQNLIDRAVKILQSGGVIAYPTETFYGLGAHAGITAAVERVFLIKGRSPAVPIALILGGGGNLTALVKDVPLAARTLIPLFWPGALTLVFFASTSILPRLTAGTGKIGLRVSGHPIANALAQGLQFPLTATSANLSGAKSCTEAGEVNLQLGSMIDAIIDGGQTPGEAGSTILDVTVEPPAVLREGAIPAAEIFSALGKPQ